MKKYCFAVVLVLTVILIGCSGPDTEGKTYTIRYYGNGQTSGFAPEDRNLYKSGDTATVMGINTLKKDGYVFSNWNTKQDDNGVTYKVGETITIKNINIQLHAIWVKLP